MELRLATTLATETWLILYGLAALVAGVALDRYLRQPRNGLTSVALTRREGPLDLLQTAGAALLAQRAAPEPPPPESTFTAGRRTVRRRWRQRSVLNRDAARSYARFALNSVITGISRGPATTSKACPAMRLPGTSTAR